MNREPVPAADFPLCVDLDGTLVKSDLLVESFFRLLKKNLLYLFMVPLWLRRGKAYLKQQIAARVDLEIHSLPYNQALVEYLQAQRAGGRRVVLATASHEKFARQVAEHLGVFDAVLATGADVNLAGDRKLARLREEFGDKGFDYAANARADLAIWPWARAAVVVNPEPGVLAAARRITNVERVFDDRQAVFGAYVKALRVYQWMKNLLLFVPVVAAHQSGNLALLGNAALGFLAFSLCASSVYLLNDLLDLPDDRAHERKRLRPFAAGTIPIVHGTLLIPVLLVAAFGIGALLSPGFLAVLAVYLLCTLAYSLWLKRIMLVDVLVLAGLYTLRVIAGAAATHIPPSFWLLAFSMFVFLSLAMIKRYAELLALRKEDRRAARGRGYRVIDLVTLNSLGAAGGYMAVLVLALYINSEEVTMHYRHPQVIWLLCPLLLYWVSRLWMTAGRGNMHDDPLIFALTDRVSQLVAVAGLVVVWAAG